MQHIAFDDEHGMYRDTVQRFIAQEIVPNDQEWEDAGAVDRDLFRRAAEQGLLAMQVPAEHGGLGLDDFRFSQIVGEENRAVHEGPPCVRAVGGVVPGPRFALAEMATEIEIARTTAIRPSWPATAGP